MKRILLSLVTLGVVGAAANSFVYKAVFADGLVQKKLISSSQASIETDARIMSRPKDSGFCELICPTDAKSARWIHSVSEIDVVAMTQIQTPTPKTER